MPDAYTYVQKPTDATYTNVNTQGREQYDQASITYDDVNVFYDGVDEDAYTFVSKPTVGSNTVVSGGFSQGLLIPLTRSSTLTINNDDYTYVPKPIT